MNRINIDDSKYDGIRFDIEDEDVILVNILETIPYEYAGKDTLVVIPTCEFTSVCPWSGLPDFAEIEISYIPNYSLIEKKSLKYYLTSYRNVGIYQEHVANRILQDVSSLLNPKYLKVKSLWNVRDGLGTEVVVEHYEDEA